MRESLGDGKREVWFGYWRGHRLSLKTTLPDAILCHHHKYPILRLRNGDNGDFGTYFIF